MTYFADLTPYTYLEHDDAPELPVVNVGWLDAEHAFPKGQAPDHLVAGLARRAEHPDQLTRGYHYCELCQEARGNGEIRVRDDTRIYAAPTLVVHYITEHGYLPPEDFRAAASQPPSRPRA
jgi:hypothetical protein